MAERRMFAKTIIDSDAFLDMPLSTQALYFHLSMRADDDGFINNPNRIIRMINANNDDLRVLITKRFVLVFESGVIVIKHWRLHNTLRKDRYKPTIYQNEFQKLQLKGDGGYTERMSSGCQEVAKQLPDGCQVVDEEETSENDESKEINGLGVGCQIGNQLATQVRLGKDSLVKNTNKQTTEISEAMTPDRSVSDSLDSLTYSFDSRIQNQIDDAGQQSAQKHLDDPDHVLTPLEMIALARMYAVKLSRTQELIDLCKRETITVDCFRRCIEIWKAQGKNTGYLIGILRNAAEDPKQYQTESYRASLTAKKQREIEEWAKSETPL